MRARFACWSFNSIVVRLKGRFCTKELKVKPSFNSIVVRLKVSVGKYYDAAMASFNSIVVRLKGNSPLGVYQSRDWFQFHSGSIKS